MYLALDSHEQEIANAAADFLKNEFPLQRLHACPQDPNSLKAFAELGWLGITAAEEVGGIGLSVVEEMLFFLELGRVAGPAQVLPQTIAVAIAADNSDICAELIGGDSEVALLVEQGEGGKIRFIGSAAAKYAVSLSETSAVLHTLNGESCQQVLCLDRSVAMYLGEASALTQVLAVESNAILQKIRIDIAAMMIGLAETALEMIVEYAKDRQTFGRPIGAYQAVRHPCSDMAVRVEGARSQLFYAATALKEGHDDADMQISAAVMLAERAAKANTDTNIQLHGGIGVTDELDAHLLLKRANLLCRLTGSAKALRTSLLNSAAQ